MALDSEKKTANEAELKRLFQRIQNGSARCVVVGLGMVGRMQGVLLAHAGFHVHGIDTCSDAIGRCRSGELPFSSYATRIDPMVQVDVVFVCVRVGVEADQSIDSGSLHSVIEQVGALANPPGLVLLVTTVPVGTTEVVADLLRQKAGDREWNVGFSPERISLHQKVQEVRGTPRLVSGTTSQALQLAESVISRICERVVPVSDPAVAEMSKLLENAFRSTAIGLVGEITRLCQGFQISAAEVCEAAATKPFGYFPFYPGPGVGGHCLPNDLVLLMGSSPAGSVSFLEEVQKSLRRMPGYVVSRVVEILGGNCRNRKILLVGVGFKADSEDTTNSPATFIARDLIRQDADVFYFDSVVSTFDVEGNVKRVTDFDKMHWDVAVLVSGDRRLSVDQLRDSATVILDAGGGRNMAQAASGVLRL